MKSLFVFVVAAAGLFAIAAVAGVWGAFVVTKLWAWFVVAHFGAKALTLPVAYGIGLLFELLTLASKKQSHGGGEDSSKNALHVLSVAFVAPAIALLAGYIAKGFM